MLFENFRNGINLGGWLSQYDVNESRPFTNEERSEHFKNFIVEKNIRQIAEWGFDHVRLPVDGSVLLDIKTGKLSEEIKASITRCLAWCRQYRLNIIIDLHDLEGNIYGEMDVPIPMLVNEEYRSRFFTIWEEITKWLKPCHEPEIMFELFNEISDATGYLWRKLYRDTVDRIRSIDTKRWILVGSSHQNSVQFLPELDLLSDKLVFYNFHFYDPQVFTHQKAHFSEEMREFNQAVTYPGDITAFKNYLKEHPKWYNKHSLTAEEVSNDYELMCRLLEYAEKFLKYSGRELYCGEYGVIDSAPPKEAAKWIKDFNKLADEYGFGRGLWNYKALDFGLVDKDNNIVHEELIKLLFG